MKKGALVSLIVGVVSLLLIAPSFAITISPITLSFQPSSQTVLPGSSLNVDVQISGLHAANEIVSAFDLFVNYDPGILSATTVTFGSYLGDPTFFEAITGSDVSSPGTVNFSEISFLPDFFLTQPDSFTLATLSFDAIGLGTTVLDFMPHPIFGFNDVKGFNGQPLVLSTASGSVNVVPEPGTLLLLGSGLAGVATWSRMKRKR